MTDHPACAVTAAQDADREHGKTDLMAWIKLPDERVRVMLEAAAPHLTAAATAAERERAEIELRAAVDAERIRQIELSRDAAWSQAAAVLEAERARLRDNVTVLSDWLEHLPMSRVPLRVGEVVARLQVLTAPGEGEDTP